MTMRVALLAAGGTGGHLFPAQALAVELKLRGWTIHLATDERADSQDFPANEIHIIPSDTVRSKNPIRLARTAISLALGVLKARRVLKKIKADVAVGFGGYPSLPPLYAANMLRIPSIIHEANAVLGRANKILAPKVTAIGLAAENTALLEDGWRAKARVVGMPLREAVLKAASQEFVPPGDNGEIRLLVFGGSQGARIFADVVPEALGRLSHETRARIALVQQTRGEDLARAEAAIALLGLKSAEIAPFFKDLPQRIADAHLVVCRSGASTVNELTAIGRPSILVPLPHALDNDQLRNAQRLGAAGAAIIAEQKELTSERLSALFSLTLQDSLWMENCARAAKSIGRPDAVKLLADLVEETASKTEGMKRQAS
ncbi:MAG: undecaprenyldiphospho-muramoylpentapeptide beta-N-acetylglucosaminyltransferase [Pseudomonadota bacterium]